ELDALRTQGVVGDIGTVFFRADGSYDDIALNRRSSGPELASLARHRHAVCLVAGEDKLAGVRGALRGGFRNTLEIDEPSAAALRASETEASSCRLRARSRPEGRRCSPPRTAPTACAGSRRSASTCSSSVAARRAPARRSTPPAGA